MHQKTVACSTAFNLLDITPEIIVIIFGQASFTAEGKHFYNVFLRWFEGRDSISLTAKARQTKSRQGFALKLDCSKLILKMFVLFKDYTSHTKALSRVSALAMKKLLQNIYEIRLRHTR